MHYIYLLLAIIAEVFATSALKSSEGYTKLYPSLVSILLYGVSFYLLSLTVKHIPIGVAYAVWSGLGIVLINAIGYFYYHDTINLSTIIGLLLIISGVIIVNLSTNAH
ncbi:multidrug efflux SMR transporter [Flammeovirga yaeyamensis]|uniref:Multidrug efflux SMR transporter n=1 Tax=Flammeovirga yaeyamensis TaxID=367791 RepID=A0AAX1N2Q8_9BACT|nr:multidrug efflux SMR transporter [Flammeovirga yaeyamensis]MBB3700832.1 small multidrug resistance pump [Flammeovirga yaeyamensis]NMF37813.1 multidrug efflux SMR transporter [Flammeovirga yaeyamensis]QWG01825.1 multidrug efflux SMR transporter [Flammeovirga yaeyamensis]